MSQIEKLQIKQMSGAVWKQRRIRYLGIKIVLVMSVTVDDNFNTIDK